MVTNPGGKDDYEVAGTACLELLGKYGAARSVAPPSPPRAHHSASLFDSE